MISLCPVREGIQCEPVDCQAGRLFQGLRGYPSLPRLTPKTSTLAVEGSSRSNIKLTAAAGALNGLFEAQKRLAGSNPSFANSGFLEISKVSTRSTQAYLDSLLHAQS